MKIETLKNLIAENRAIVLYHPDGAACQLNDEEVKMIVDALEKQIPKKPKDTEFGRECAVCGSVVEFGDKVARINCCPWCFQKIDWSEEE